MTYLVDIFAPSKKGYLRVEFLWIYFKNVKGEVRNRQDKARTRIFGQSGFFLGGLAAVVMTWARTFTPMEWAWVLATALGILGVAGGLAALVDTCRHLIEHGGHAVVTACSNQGQTTAVVLSGGA